MGISTDVLVWASTSSTGLMIRIFFLLLALVIFIVRRMNGGSADSDVGMPVTEADRERDAEQWAEYQRSRARLSAPKPASAQKPAVPANDARRQRLEALLMITPGAREQIEALMARTQGQLDEGQQLDLALETARRLSQARA